MCECECACVCGCESVFVCVCVVCVVHMWICAKPHANKKRNGGKKQRHTVRGIDDDIVGICVLVWQDCRLLCVVVSICTRELALTHTHTRYEHARARSLTRRRTHAHTYEPDTRWLPTVTSQIVRAEHADLSLAGRSVVGLIPSIAIPPAFPAPREHCAPVCRRYR